MQSASTFISRAKKAFLAVAGDLDSSEGSIDLLIGMDHMDDAPREHERGQGLVLYRSVFSTGYIVCVNMNNTKEDDPSAGCQ
jgi:hypothetical protein